MTDDQRANIRRRCLELLHEPDDVVSSILAATAERELIKREQDCRMQHNCFSKSRSLRVSYFLVSKPSVNMTTKHILTSPRPTLLEDIVNMINATMHGRYAASAQAATPEAFIALKRSLEALNAVLKEFVNIKLLGGIRTCSQVSSDFNYISYTC